MSRKDCRYHHPPSPRPGFETDLASRFRSSHRGHGKVELEGVGGQTAQTLDTLVEYVVVGYMLACSLAKALTRVVSLGKALGRIVGTTPPPARLGLETDLASRFKSSHRGHGRSLYCCSGYC